MKKIILYALLIISLCSCGNDKKINLDEHSNNNSTVTQAPTGIDDTGNLINSEYVERFGEKLAPYYHIEWKEELRAKDLKEEEYKIYINAYTNVENSYVDSVYHYEQDTFDEYSHQKIIKNLIGDNAVYSNEIEDYPQYKINELIISSEAVLADAKEKLNSASLSPYEKEDYENRVRKSTLELNKYKKLLETAPVDWRTVDDFSGNNFWCNKNTSSENVYISFYTLEAKKDVQIISVDNYPLAESNINVTDVEALALMNNILDKVGYIHASIDNYTNKSISTDDDSAFAEEEQQPFVQYYVNDDIPGYNNEYFGYMFKFYDNKVSFTIKTPIINIDVSNNVALLKFPEIKNIICEYLSDEINNYYEGANCKEFYVQEIKLSLVNDAETSSIIPAWQIYTATRGYGADLSEIIRINAIDGSLLSIPDRRPYDKYLDEIHKK